MPTMTTVGCRTIIKMQLRIMRVVHATRYAAARLVEAEAPRTVTTMRNRPQ